MLGCADIIVAIVSAILIYKRGYERQKAKGEETKEEAEAA